MSKILVTGGTGFIGGHLAELLADLGHEVTVFDNLSGGSYVYFEHTRLVIGDVNNYRDISAVMLSERFDYVFHYAAIVGVQKTLNNPMDVLRDMDGLMNILTLCKNTLVKRIFYASSSEVYGDSPSYPQDEDRTPLNARLPYAVVKSMGEVMVKTFYQQYALDYTIYRFFNTYGERQRKDFVMSKFIDLALSGKNLTIYGDGSQTRTFLYVTDNVLITTLPLTKDYKYFLNDTINIGSPDEIDMNELASIVTDITGHKVGAIYIDPLSEGDMPRRKPDIDKIKDKITWSLVPLREGIKRVIKSMQ
jgi:nucleoside-diphosphate-sugar epimerase